MTEQKKGSTVFNREFKIASLVRLINEPHLVVKLKESLFPEIFNTKEEHEPLVRLAKIVIERATKKNTVSMEGIFGFLQLQADGPERESALNLFEEIRDGEKYWKLAKNDEFFQSFLDYVKMMRIYTGSQQVVDKFRKGELDAAFEAHDKVESDLRSINLDIIETIDWGNTFEELTDSSANRKTQGLRIGLFEFDQTGGFAPQTLNVFAANTGGGKGMMTIHLARSCAMQKKPVYIAVVEDTKSMFMRRLISSETGISYSKIQSNFHELTEAEKELVKSKLAALKEYVDVEFPFGSHYKAILERFRVKQAERKRLGLPPYEVFILDYLGHAVKTHITAHQQEYQLLTRAMRDLRDFGLVENLITFTHWQLSSNGKKKEADGDLISNYDIAGATDMVNLVDNAIGINRSPENRKKSVAILNFFKGREGFHEAEFEVNTAFDTARYDFRNVRRIDSSAAIQGNKPSTPPPPPAPRQPFVASGTKPVLTGAPPQKPQQ